jgi:glycosyltransferase involved in cell wall biosynthesis
MPEPLSISCFVITKNEADRLQRTLQSVSGLVAQIIVVDSGSTDETVTIAKAQNATVLYKNWQGFGPQKRFAETQCTHDWVLNLDADEVLTTALADEIRALFANGPPKEFGARFRQTTVYPEQKEPRLWADYHNYIRLYDRTKMRFSTSPSHDAVDPNGHTILQLRHPALHYSWRSLNHLTSKYDSYTDLQATTLTRKPLVILYFRLLSEFPVHFIKTYLFRRHITGGTHGLAVSLIIARARWQRIKKLLITAKENRNRAV